ncbi:LuxR family two component transcriptional regulator [Catenovulum agarivorans DS-2]|uniref:LuxR family two component transcriptional regulator n=1 Tax=Catenovulum agarivorans DS-2 TaxID=1328313 RepID=W7QVN0_9ALTE|nr:response regulator transcription factor [Catenovulum agarivorans]EWH09345.1 LuxR family two component transcriptional regulator [Catenovulum agarivorans DS-2]
MNEIQKILIIEDIPEVSFWLHAQVSALLPERPIDHADTLAMANKAASLQTYDLVLVDLGLPDGNGSSFIKAYKTTQPNALCVVTTIFDDAEHLIEALRAGADGYLLKDDTESDFINQLAGILDGRPPLSASIARFLLEQFHPNKEEQIVLTQRETDMLTLAAKGLSVKHAAELLGISYNTAAGYLKEVYRKLQVNTRAEATIKAINLGLINAK